MIPHIFAFVECLCGIYRSEAKLIPPNSFDFARMVMENKAKRPTTFRPASSQPGGAVDIIGAAEKSEYRLRPKALFKRSINPVDSQRFTVMMFNLKYEKNRLTTFFYRIVKCLHTLE